MFHKGPLPIYGACQKWHIYTSNLNHLRTLSHWQGTRMSIWICCHGWNGLDGSSWLIIIWPAPTMGLSGWVVPNFTFNNHKNQPNVAPRVQGELISIVWVRLHSFQQVSWQNKYPNCNELGVSSNMSRNGGKTADNLVLDLFKVNRLGIK
jgi:hypothetical protein